MRYWKVKFRSTDTMYSKYIRRGGVCEICGRSDIKLEAAHYFTRGKENTRFDDRNVHCLCFTCHKKSHEDKSYYKDWLIGKYGQKWFDKLELDSNTYKKQDDITDKMILKELLKKYEIT